MRHRAIKLLFRKFQNRVTSYNLSAACLSSRECFAAVASTLDIRTTVCATNVENVTGTDQGLNAICGAGLLVSALSMSY